MTDVETSGSVKGSAHDFSTEKSTLESVITIVIDIHDPVEVLMEYTQIDDKRPSRLQKHNVVHK